MIDYYNENDSIAVAWLRWLIDEGHLPPGLVDERSIVDVQPEDLKGFRHVHLFAGIGGWALAAKLAGWSDDSLWTASCPCQPFSVAGKRAGRDDPRHLWPHVFRLARAARPPVLVGEQVAGKAGYDWFDGVAADLEAEGYACRAVDIPACAVDAPHIRQRLYWVAVADADGGGRAGRTETPERQAVERVTAERPASGNLGDAFSPRLEGQRGNGDAGGQPFAARPVAKADGSFWSDAKWIVCHDGKARRTQPGLRLLVDGISGRVAAWRGFGNAIVPPLAAEVLIALKECLDHG